ncbi:MAG: Signal transduction histidine kinase containing PAS domain [Candidatus Methanohalarchaeum thermophilum]|uniref:Signal transduction histidine kinase containing PAS domain n=1 Tax=Methanohalarchaeum thermophilum TaxID=1903181 RepID=A0A1Q6DRU2_METT1|nr:MAG: Signal transduction histidine kinase containing PAS domain [Candidatus Methanohalarchaeum thermophilum]
MAYPEAKDVEIPEEIIEKWQKIVDIMAEVIDVPAGLIMRVKPPYIEVFRANKSEENPYEVGEKEELAGLYCEKVIKSKDKLLVPHAQKDERWKNNPDVELGMVSYLGFPLEWPDEDVFGTICVLDSEENRYGEKYEDLMKEFRELVESHLKLIYQRKELERHIQEREEAEKREDFLHSLLRHDVRNKLQITQGYLDLSKSHNLPRKVENYFSQAEEATKKSVEIIEKVRTLRKLSEEEEKNEIKLCQLLQNVIDNHKKVLEENKIELNCQKKEIKALGGPLLEELFSNLLENAVKHADCEKIKISVKEGETLNTITVEDNGKGIPDEIKPKIFKRGFKDKETGGTGLGLYLAKEITENYGGKIEVRDSELGGARFDVTLKKP